jgi:molecular chaperone DnaJ
VCGGRGVVDDNQGLFSFSSPCHNCRGRGSVIQDPCPTCHGSGVERRPREVATRIPAGVSDGQTLRLKGRGAPGRNGGPAGDLLVEISVKPHPTFARSGDNLTVTVPVTFAEAALGADIDVPTLEGSQKLKIPEGTQNGTKFKLRHQGVPNINGGGRGDLYVHVDVKVPTRLSREQRKLLEQLKDTLPVDNAPAEKGLFEKVKNYFM